MIDRSIEINSRMIAYKRERERKEDGKKYTYDAVAAAPVAADSAAEMTESAREIERLRAR